MDARMFRLLEFIALTTALLAENPFGGPLTSSQRTPAGRHRTALRIRSRVMANLGGTDPDSQEIGNQIAALHRRLSADPLEDRNRKLSRASAGGRQPRTNLPLRAKDRSHARPHLGRG